jgi:hypothetical protein
MVIISFPEIPRLWEFYPIRKNEWEAQNILASSIT